MNLTYKETGKLTLKQFNKLYQCYKDDFDFELILKLNRMTYKDAHKKSNQNDEWF